MRKYNLIVNYNQKMSLYLSTKNIVQLMLVLYTKVKSNRNTKL